MKLHEHQAKELLKRYGLPVPEGRVAFSLQEALQAAEELGEFPLVVKAQVHCGGRGKAGGVKLVKNMEELQQAVEGMLGKVLKTFQCPDGKPVSRVWIEKATNIGKEYYLSITLDRSVSKPVLMASAEGGMEIEEVAKEKPEAIHMLHIDPALGLMPSQARKMAFKLGLPVNEFVKIAVALYRAYIDLDASLVEINPLVLTKEGNLILLDAKVELDDNALIRHKDLEELEDLTQLDPLEVEAKKYSLNYIKLDGNIGCMVNGAGLAMTTMDIFGGILRCDRLANGLIEAAKMVEIKVPVVVRMEGTNVEEGRKILAESGLNFINAVDMWDGAQKAVALASKGG